MPNGRPIIANTDQVMIRELRRQGGLLNKVHLDDGAYSAETAAALRLISDDQVNQLPVDQSDRQKRYPTKSGGTKSVLLALQPYC